MIITGPTKTGDGKDRRQNKPRSPSERNYPATISHLLVAVLVVHQILVDVFKSLGLVERHHADIHASEQRILHIILQTTEVLGSIKKGVLSNCGGAIVVVSCVIPDDR